MNHAKISPPQCPRCSAPHDHPWDITPKNIQGNKDKDNLLDRLEALLPETKIACYAWALLTNNAHFLNRTGK